MKVQDLQEGQKAIVQRISTKTIFAAKRENGRILMKSAFVTQLNETHEPTSHAEWHDATNLSTEILDDYIVHGVVTA